MMNKTKLHALLAKRLYGLLYSTNPTFFPSNNKSFIALFEKELDILACLEKTEAKKNDLGTRFLAKSLIQKYNSLSKNNFVLSKKNYFVDKNNLDNLEDDINYLFIFCKNIFKVNIDDIVDKVLFNKQSKTLSNSETEQKTINEEPSSQQIFPEFKNIFNNSYIYSLATSKAMKDISLGKIYIYKTRPRIIPVLKIILLVLIAFACLTSLLISITSFVVNRIPYGDKELDFLWAGLSHFIYAIICAHIVSIIVRQIKQKNLNQKYFFSWRLVIPYLLGAVLIVFFYFIYVLFFMDWYLIAQTNQLQYICCRIIYYSNLFAFILLMAIVVCSIMASFYNPKKDKTIIQTTINKYVDEISRSQTPFAS